MRAACSNTHKTLPDEREKKKQKEEEDVKRKQRRELGDVKKKGRNIEVFLCHISNRFFFVTCVCS